jgi:hypothetical protein
MVLLFLPARPRIDDVAEQEEEFIGEHAADLLTD